MIEFPLQTVGLDTLSAIRQASEVVSVVLGLAISYIAYRGYRRNQSRPMLLVAVGFVLIVGLPAVLTVALFFVLDLPLPVVNSLVQLSELLGLGTILYGLWTPRSS